MGVPKYADLFIPAAASPSADAGGLLVFCKSVSGRNMLTQIGPAGIETALQPSIARNKIGWIEPVGNGTTISSTGLQAPTATGTPTAANVAITNLHAMMRRVEYLVTAAATTAVAGFRNNTQIFARGNAAKIGGFHFVCRWAPATGVATATSRAFCGMIASTNAPTDVEPSSQVNIVGMGWDAADTNIQIMHNDASGTATKVNLGASFPVPTVDRQEVYEIAIFCPPNGTDFKWEVTNLVSGAVATGTITTDLIANTQLITYSCWMSVGGTSAVVGVTLFGLYIETDY